MQVAKGTAVTSEARVVILDGAARRDPNNNNQSTCFFEMICDLVAIFIGGQKKHVRIHYIYIVVL